MSLPEYAIPLASILVPLGTLFVVRSLDKGEKKRERLHIDFEHLETRVSTLERDLNRLLGRMNGQR